MGRGRVNPQHMRRGPQTPPELTLMNIVGGILYRGELVEFTDRESMQMHEDYVQGIEDMRSDRARELRTQRRERDAFLASFRAVVARRRPDHAPKRERIFR